MVRNGGELKESRWRKRDWHMDRILKNVKVDHAVYKAICDLGDSLDLLRIPWSTTYRNESAGITNSSIG